MLGPTKPGRGTPAEVQGGGVLDSTHPGRGQAEGRLATQGRLNGGPAAGPLPWALGGSVTAVCGPRGLWAVRPQTQAFSSPQNVALRETGSLLAGSGEMRGWSVAFNAPFLCPSWGKDMDRPAHTARRVTQSRAGVMCPQVQRHPGSLPLPGAGRGLGQREP